jgi:hypothetical protein
MEAVVAERLRADSSRAECRFDPAGSPNVGSAGVGIAGVSGVPPGPANVGGLNNSGNDPSGVGNSAKSPDALGKRTPAAGTANIRLQATLPLREVRSPLERPAIERAAPAAGRSTAL